MGWSADQSRTACRRFVAALDCESGGWGPSISVEGAYHVLDTCSARELGRVRYSWRGDDPASRLELDVERREDGSERVVARTVLRHHDGSDELVATQTFDAPPDGEIGAPAVGPHLLFELEEPPVTRARLVNAVDALRGRLALALRGRDPRAVRLVPDDRIAVELRGDAEDAVLAALALDRPAILDMPPLQVLVEEASPYSSLDSLQLDVRLACDVPVPESVDVRIDGARVDTVATHGMRPGRTSLRLRDDPDAHLERVRLLPYPLRSALRRVA